MVTRVGFGAALVLTLTLLLSACSPPGPVNPVSVTDPYSLGGTTIDLMTSGGGRFLGTKNPASSFSDLPTGILPLVAVSSYAVTLSIVGATVTGPNPPPATLTLTSPGGTVTLSDGSIPGGVAIDFFSTGTWTLQQTAANPPDYTYTVSGTASLVTMVTLADASLLAQVVSVTTLGGDNQAAVQFGVTATGLSTADTLTLQFGPGSAVYNF